MRYILEGKLVLKAKRLTHHCISLYVYLLWTRALPPGPTLAFAINQVAEVLLEDAG